MTSFAGAGKTPFPSEALKRQADEIAMGILVARNTGARLERHGDLIVLREGDQVHAIGVLDNGSVVYPTTGTDGFEYRDC